MSILEVIQIRRVEFAMPYTIALHQHRLAAWAASTAARASPYCRFKVEKGIKVLERAGFNQEFSAAINLPQPEDLDHTHLEWRSLLIGQAHRLDIDFSHGVAAKLLNTYFKVRFVCGGENRNERVACLHPPIDRLLLDGLARADLGGFRRQWQQFKDWGWSSYTSDQYQEVIEQIRLAIPGRPLWEIEEHWRGHQ
jgi:hypothetical protein